MINRHPSIEMNNFYLKMFLSNSIQTTQILVGDLILTLVGDMISTI